MAAKPLTLQDGMEVHITHVSIVRGVGGRKFRIEHQPPKIRLVKTDGRNHNDTPDQSPPTLHLQGGQAPT